LQRLPREPTSEWQGSSHLAHFAVNNWGAPIEFLEYDPFTNTLRQAPTPPNNNAQLYWSGFMLLPTGQVLFGPSSSNVQCYTPDGGPQDAWRPVISSVEHQGLSSPTVHYLLKGTQLNGLSQANMYGDDCNPSTNYPLVRLRCSVTGQVYFARTYDFSTSAVATGQAPQSVRFSAAHITYGHYELYVIANGISSNCISFRHHRLCQACGCKECCREKPDCCCEPIGEKENAMPEPDIIALRSQVHQLSRSTERFGSRIVVEEPHQQPKEVKRDAKRAETRRPACARR